MGELVFQHACRGKQFLANGIEIPNLIHRNWPLEAHKLLSERWDGRIYPESSRSDPEAFNVILGDICLPIELLPGGNIRGGSGGFRRWHKPQPDTLYLIDNGRVRHILNRDGNGWSGSGISLVK